MEKPRWKNWSGSLSFSPGEIATPESEEEVVDLVKAAAKGGRKVRVVGAGHSSSPLVKTRDVLLSLKHFRGAEDPDEESGRLTILSGMTVKEAGKEAFRYGLAMHNTGDVDVQTIAGAIGTGTHGTGVELKNLSSMLAGVRMVTGNGEILEASIDNDKELFRGLQVAMGTCGIFLKMRLQLEKAYRLHRKEWCVPIDKCLENLEDLKKNRNFDFYWYPRSDLAKIRVMNEEGGKCRRYLMAAWRWKKRVTAMRSCPFPPFKFDEMEYVLAADKAIDCFLEVRDLIKNHGAKKSPGGCWFALYSR
jgi:FAD/FMN-containing dehydrogenase